MESTRREAVGKIAKLAGLSAGTAALGLWLRGRSRRPEEPVPTELRKSFGVAPNANLPEMVVARGEEPGALVRRAIEAMGGISRFVSRGDVVLVKPNVGWDRTAEQAANTNPEVVAEVVRLCFGAGAKRVVVTDVSTNEPRRCFQRSGIGRAAKAAGAQVILPEDRLFRDVNLRGEVLTVWPVLQPFLEADKMINVAIAKHHSLTGATLGIKNWYGILGGPRHQLHQHIHESLADLADFMRPTLTLIDAWRVLLRNGPTGGNLEDVSVEKTLIAGTDPVAVDSWAAKAYWGMDQRSLPYLEIANARGLGQYDLAKVRMKSEGVDNLERD